MNSAFNNSYLGCKSLLEILEAVKTFKVNQLIRHHEEVILGRGRKMRATVRFRHDRLYQAVTQFNDFNIVQKTSELLDYALYLGWLMSSVNSKK